MDELSEDQSEPIISERSPNVAVSKNVLTNRYWVKRHNQKPNETTPNQRVQTKENADKANREIKKVRNPFTTTLKVRTLQRQWKKLKQAMQHESTVRKPEQPISNEIGHFGTISKPDGESVDSKGLQKIHSAPITIRNIDKENISELEEEEEDVITLQTKTKGFRKRRASSIHDGVLSMDNSGSDKDDGVEWPFIVGAPIAVASYKRKKLPKSPLSQSHVSQSAFLAMLDSLPPDGYNEEMIQPYDDDDDDSDNERFRTATRYIAETVLNQQEQTTLINVEPIEQPAMEDGESIVDSRDVSEMAVPAEIADGIEKLFDKVNELAAKKKTVEDSDGSDCEPSDGVSQVNDSVNVLPSTKEQPVEQSLEQSAPAKLRLRTDGDIKYFVGYSPANRLCVSDGFGWNEEMRRFYNFSWGGENFRVRNVLRGMNGNKSLWTISEADRSFIINTRVGGEKCFNCCSFGHTRARCPQPQKPIVCYMCGENGHQETRCPNACCLQCGSKTSIYSQNCRKCINWNKRMCPICKLPGHSLKDCPDKWRRYHSTTRPNVLLDTRVIYNRRLYCCHCGRRGHLVDECRNAIYVTEYPPISSEIQSHEKSYEDMMISPFTRPEIPCRLLFDPKVKANSELGAKTTENHAYGRFLAAVGLRHLIGVSSFVNRTNPPPSEGTVLTSNQVLSEVRESTNLLPPNTLESLQMQIT